MDVPHLHKQIDQLTEAFTVSFGTLNQEALNWKPDPASWSIAQNIMHLILLNESYYPAIRSLQQGTYAMPWLGRFSGVTGFFGTMLLRAVQPDRKQKLKTLGLWQPQSSTIAADVLTQFADHQQGLKQMIEACQPLVSQGAVIASPANRIVVYKLGTALNILVTHEWRHLEQAKEVLALMKKQHIAVGDSV